MRSFVERALAKSGRMNEEQLRALLGALAEENGRMEAALDSMLDAIVVCDRYHLPIISNKSAERMFRLSASEGGERPFWFLVPDPELSAFLRRTLEGDESVLDREFELEAPGGRRRLVAVSVTALLSRGRIAGSLVHAEDITEKRRREAQLRRAESLASLTTLAAGVAHEIKNPLGSISIHIQLMQRALKARAEASLPPAESSSAPPAPAAGRSSAIAPAEDRPAGTGAAPIAAIAALAASAREGGQAGDRVSDPLAAALSRHLGVVTEEIERLNKIVVDFLFAVRPMDVELRESDPGALLREVAEFIRPEAEEAGVELELELDEGLPLVLLDRRYIKQALLNLAKNALAAMPAGGRLGLSALASDDEVRLLVADTGTGIPEADLPKIFEPYFTTKDSGTGLGLTITFKIVKEHRGEINVRSKPGQGSTFTISLPVPQRERRLLSFVGSAEGAAEGPERDGGAPAAARDEDPHSAGRE